MTTSMDGNHAAAYAMKQINPDVVAAYPITPVTYLMEAFTQYVADGQIDTEMILVESEHSAMSACVGAAACGTRAMTASASQGLALMHEVLYNASGMRLPIVIIVGNRALSAPLSIHCDHSDSMAERDSGFIMIYAKDAQEVYDLTLQAFPIAEHKKVRTPIMICMDGLETTHTIQPLELLDDQKVKTLLGENNPFQSLLDSKNPITYGAAVKPDYYFEHRRNQLEGMMQAGSVIKEVGTAYGKLSGRDYSEPIVVSGPEKAKYAVIMIGSFAGTFETYLPELSDEVSLLRVRQYRPFPTEKLLKILKDYEKVAVLDRTSPAGNSGGPLFTDVVTALQGTGIKARNYIYGLGGRTLLKENVEQVVEDFSKKTPTLQFLNLRD
ncbi:MAG: pyruvate ferredoxin oxidoreductase [Candidatus Gracilibacteria bacterium]|nr:pyruvate ferredoxin oxidoreductase [Candidatus Gracilibacteria bacterium]